MLFYSHWLDLVGKLASLAIIVTILLVTNSFSIIDQTMSVTPNPQFFVFATLTLIVVGFYFAFHRPLIDVLVTQLYIRQRFGVQASWEEARILRNLFCLNLRTLQWTPMTHVQSLPIEQRLQALLEAAYG
jgi:hypothetical protein